MGVDGGITVLKLHIHEVRIAIIINQLYTEFLKSWEYQNIPSKIVPSEDIGRFRFKCVRTVRAGWGGGGGGGVS